MFPPLHVAPLPSSQPQSASSAIAVPTSHQLLLRAGMIRPAGSGLYTLLPLGQRVLIRLQGMVEQELQALGAERLSLPQLQPASVVEKAGVRLRAEDGQFRLQDRQGAELLLQSGHEQSVAALVAGEVRSWRELPLRLYEVSRAFRDEQRPRAGLLRSRESVTQAMYSFDVSEDRALQFYDEAKRACGRLLRRLGLRFHVADADAGGRGGNACHQLHIPSPVGDVKFMTCTRCDYAANADKAQALLPRSHYARQPTVRTNLSEDNVVTRHVRSLLPAGVRSDVSVKYEVVLREEDGQTREGGDVCLVFLSEGREVNVVSVREHVGWHGAQRVVGSEALRAMVAVKDGRMQCRVLVDGSLVAEGVDLDVLEMDVLENAVLRERDVTAEQRREMDDLVAAMDVKEEEVMGADGDIDGAKLMQKVEAMMQGDRGRQLMSKLNINVDPAGNMQFGQHLDKQQQQQQSAGKEETERKQEGRNGKEQEDEGGDLDAEGVRSLEDPKQGDFRYALAGDRCAQIGCSGELKEARGIDVAQLTLLGSEMTAAVQAVYRSSKGQLRPMEMGAFTLELSRLVAAVVESSHDAHGIVWPAAIAPYQVIVLPVSEAAVSAAMALYDRLSASGVFHRSVLLDDRLELRLPARLHQSQLMGAPWTLIIGEAAVKDGIAELQERRGGADRRVVKLEEAVGVLEQMRMKEDEDCWARGGSSQQKQNSTS